MVRDHMTIGLRWRMCCCLSYIIFVKKYDANSTCNACQIYLVYHLLNNIIIKKFGLIITKIYTRQKEKKNIQFQ